MSKKVDPTKPVQTRDGRKVRILCTDLKGRDETVVALVSYIDVETLYTYFPDGRYFSLNEEHPADLVNVPTKRKGWINVFMSWENRPFVGEDVYESAEEAKAGSADADNYVATVCIEWED